MIAAADEWKVTVPVWQLVLIAFVALVVIVLTVALAMSAGAADRRAEFEESYSRQRAIRDQALREHEHRTRNRH